MSQRWSSEFVTAMEHRDLQANAMALDSSGSFVLLAGRRFIAIKDLDDADPEKVRKFPRQSKYDVGVAEWNPTSFHAELCVISCNGKLELLTWRSGELIQTLSLRAHTRVITDLNWHRSDPNLFASCSADTFIHVWDIRDARRPILSLSAIAEASQVRWNRMSPYFIATSHDGDVKIWDQRKGGTPVQYIAAHLSKIHGLDWSPHSETQLVTSSQDSTVKFFDVCNPRRAEFVLTTDAPVWRARHTPFGTGLLTVVVPQLRRGETSLHLWNCTNRSSPVHTFIGHRDVVLDFEWRKQRAGDSHYQLVTWSKDQTLLVWRIEPYLQKLCGHNTDEIRQDHSQEGINTEDNEIFIQPLQQEFSLLNVLISNLEVIKMDANERCCSVMASANNVIVNLNITFPKMYPNGVAPVFQIAPGSQVKESIANQLVQTITRTAVQRVSKNRTCLEPCLRQFVAVLEQLTTITSSSSTSDLGRSQNAPFLDSAEIMGSFNDACVPFPRTSGARFASTATLVCFGHNLRIRHGNSKAETTTPRALSALGTTKFGCKVNFLHNYSSFYMPKHRHRSKYHHHHHHHSHNHHGNNHHNKAAVQRSVVSVYDASALFNESKHLAREYVLNESVSGICRINSEIATSLEKWEAAMTWTLVGIAVKSSQEQQQREDENSETWKQHPFRNQLIESLITFYARQPDLQMAAMLSCVYEMGYELNAKKIQPSSSRTSSHQNGSYYSPLPADVVAEGWVFPLTRTCRFLNQPSTNLNEEKNVIDAKQAENYYTSRHQQYDYYKLIYAEMLFRWGLLNNRAEILKFLYKPLKLFEEVEFVKECQHCSRPAKNIICPSCRKLPFNCTICNISVRGSSNFCLICGHGGHSTHIEKWFSRNKVCPSGCGCNCLLKTAETLF